MLNPNPKIRVHTRERSSHRNKAAAHSVLAVYYFKGTTPRTVTGRRRGINISGVDFWHAVEFSRNGRFLRTHPHGLSSGRFPPVLHFRLYQTVSGSDFLGAFQVSAFAFPFPADPTLSEILRSDFPPPPGTGSGARSARVPDLAEP